MKLVKYILFLTVIAFTACNPSSKKSHSKEETPQDTIAQAPPVQLLYGLPMDSFILEHKKVKRNEYLGSILSAYGVDYGVIDKLSRNYKDVFDVRKLKRGNPYTAFLTKDSIPQLRYFVYEKSVAEYVVYDLCDTAFIYAGQKDIITQRKRNSGVITSSLWNAMVDNQINPMLAIELSEIYAWSIDFFGIAEQDSFTVIYDEQFVDSTSLGISKIHGAVFSHLGHPYYALPFMQDSVESFFDEDGKSLKKAFLKAPLRYSRISSGFSNNRYHPVLKYYRPHHGIDYAAPTGTPVQSIGDGKVIAKGYQARGGGNYLKIKHNSVYTSVYMHLHGFSKGIHTGSIVKQGQQIGTVGATGLATGPHLDFRIFMNGKPVNPLTVKAPPVEPIKEENMAAFNKEKQNIIAELYGLPVKQDSLQFTAEIDAQKSVESYVDGLIP